MEFEHIIYEKKRGVVWLTLNRPEVLNALNRAMWRELNQAIDLADKDDARARMIKEILLENSKSIDKQRISLERVLYREGFRKTIRWYSANKNKGEVEANLENFSWNVKDRI